MHNTIYKSHIISIRLAVGGYQQIMVSTINSTQLYPPPITRVFTTGFRRSLNKIDKKKISALFNTSSPLQLHNIH